MTCSPRYGCRDNDHVSACPAGLFERGVTSYTEDPILTLGRIKAELKIQQRLGEGLIRERDELLMALDEARDDASNGWGRGALFGIIAGIIGTCAVMAYLGGW